MANVVALPERLIEKHGAPEFIRSDNGPEFIAEAIQEFVKACGLEMVFITPGSPLEERL